MNFSQQTKHSRLVIFGFLIVLGVVSCSRAEQSNANLAQIPSPSPSAQPVAYGASLSEWEEATQIDLEQVGNSNNINVGIIGSQKTAVPTTLTTILTQPDNATSSTETKTDGVAAAGAAPATSLVTLKGIVYQEIMWDALIPAGFTADAIMAKYEDQLAQIQDGSPEAYNLYLQMQAEFNNAPVNKSIDGTLVRLPGFIAPLEFTDDRITEFLLVPYFGACIHVPPPPANQTVLVKTAEGHAIKFEDAWYPVWIMGKLTTEGATTDLAVAGYYIEDAYVEPYSDSP